MPLKACGQVLLDVFVMDQRASRGNADASIDIENGYANLSKTSAMNLRQSEKLLDRVWDGFPGNAGLGGEGRSLISPCSNSAEIRVAFENSIGDKFGRDGIGDDSKQQQQQQEQKKKKNFKKPQKPPRPPKVPSLDEADRKLIREITELSMLRRARIERMKALKKTKNGKARSSSSVNIWAFIITAFFCFVIFCQGFCTKGGPNSGLEGSPVSSLENNGGLISVQYHRKMPGAEASPSSNASPNILEPVSGSDIKDDPGLLKRSAR